MPDAVPVRGGRSCEQFFAAAGEYPAEGVGGRAAREMGRCVGEFTPPVGFETRTKAGLFGREAIIALAQHFVDLCALAFALDAPVVHRAQGEVVAETGARE